MPFILLRYLLGWLFSIAKGVEKCYIVRGSALMVRHHDVEAHGGISCFKLAIPQGHVAHRVGWMTDEVLSQFLDWINSVPLYCMTHYSV